jgi:hypothetical protein
MAAGLGFKEFTTGDVLTAADANGYLASQVVMVFADAAARTTAITSPQEGMISYLKDTNATQYYSGSAWVSIGGGSSPLTTKGDLYTFSTTDARLGVGTNGHVLTADSVAATGIKWAAPPSSGMTLITSQALSATATLNINDCFSTTYRNYLLIMEVTGTAAEAISCRLRVSGSDATTNYNQQLLEAKNTSVTGSRTTGAAQWGLQATRTSGRTFFVMNINSPFEASSTSFVSPGIDPDSTISMSNLVGVNTNATSYTGISFYQSTGTMTGNVSIYGLVK